MLPTLLILAALTQDGPVLAPPADTEPSSPSAAPSSMPPSADRRASLRRILRPRATPPTPATPPTTSPPAVRPAPRDSDPLGLDPLPDDLQIQPSPPRTTARPAPTPPADPLGLDPLPPELQLLPAGTPEATESDLTPTPRTNAIGLEILPDDLNLLPPALGPDSASSTDPLADRAPSASTRRADTSVRRPRKEKQPDDSEADQALERELRKTLVARLGRQIHDVEVRVSGEHVVIRADVNFFWNRRPVRRAIESLPGLAGYKLDVETY